MLPSIETTFLFGHYAYRLSLLSVNATYHTGSTVLKVVISSPKATRSPPTPSFTRQVASVEFPSPTLSTSSRCPSLDSTSSTSGSSTDEADAADQDDYPWTSRASTVTPDPLIISALPLIKATESPVLFKYTSPSISTRPTRRLPTRPISRPLLTSFNLVAPGTFTAARKVGFGQLSNDGEGVRNEAGAEDNLAHRLADALPLTKVASTLVEDLTTLLESLHPIESGSTRRSTSSPNSTIIDTPSPAPRHRHQFPHPPLPDTGVPLTVCTPEEKEEYSRM